MSEDLAGFYTAGLDRVRTSTVTCLLEKPLTFCLNGRKLKPMPELQGGSVTVVIQEVLGSCRGLQRSL